MRYYTRSGIKPELIRVSEIWTLKSTIFLIYYKISNLTYKWVFAA